MRFEQLDHIPSFPKPRPQTKGARLLEQGRENPDKRLRTSPAHASRDRVDARKHIHNLILRRRQDSKRQGLATIGVALPRLRCQITKGNNLSRHLLSEVPLPSLRNLLRRLSERPILKLDHLWSPLRLALELTHGGVKALDRAHLFDLRRRIDHTVDEQAFVCPGSGTSTGEELVSMLQSSGTGPESKVHSQVPSGKPFMAMLLLTGQDRELSNEEMGGQGRSTQMWTLCRSSTAPILSLLDKGES